MILLEKSEQKDTFRKSITKINKIILHYNNKIKLIDKIT